MGDSAINGKTWNEAEHDMVVGDYLVMLDKVMTGRAYDPENHQRALRFVTNRSGGAITFLQGEISAVLTLIGLPTLKDHPPRWDFGDGLADSVDRCLTAKPGALKDLVQPPALLGRAAAPVLAEGLRRGPITRRPANGPSVWSPSSTPPPATWRLACWPGSASPPPWSTSSAGWRSAAARTWPTRSAWRCPPMPRAATWSASAAPGPPA